MCGHVFVRGSSTLIASTPFCAGPGAPPSSPADSTERGAFPAAGPASHRLAYGPPGSASARPRSPRRCSSDAPMDAPKTPALDAFQDGHDDLFRLGSSVVCGSVSTCALPLGGAANPCMGSHS